MGILDDAIREHLELKRKHGVPEEELQRQEEEALGPARRDVAQQHEDGEPTPGQTVTAEAEEPRAPAAGGETALFDMEEEAAADASSGDDAEPAPAAGDATAVYEPPAAEATPVEPPPVEPPPDEPRGLEAVEDEEELEEERHGEREPDDEQLLSSEEEAGAESGDPDVLEDTPDFLQETPEHDRLWFEQKPPRDFDFD